MVSDARSDTMVVRDVVVLLIRQQDVVGDGIGVILARKPTQRSAGRSRPFRICCGVLSFHLVEEESAPLLAAVVSVTLGLFIRPVVP